MVLCALPMVFSCGPSKSELAEKERLDNIRVTDSIARDSAVIAFITDMYNSSKYETEQFVMQHCSEKLVNKLRSDYDYDGEGLAFWDFRSDEQDGPNDEHRVTAITPEGNGWYKYDFIDMGVKSSHRLLISGEPDNFIIEELE